MVILGIFVLLTLASLAIVISQIYKPKLARAWIIALVSSFLAWIIIFVLRLYLPTDFPLITWSPQSLFMASPGLSLDYQNWPYALALVTLCMAVILTDSSRAYLETSPLTWAGSLAITAINLLAILAGDPLTMVMAWVFGDLVELVYLLRIQQWGKPNQGLSIVFTARLLSVFALIASTMYGWQIKPGFLLGEIPAAAGIYFLIAAGLRLGVLPIDLPFLDSEELKRGAGMLIRLTPVASALVLIAHLPSDFLLIHEGWLNLVRVLVVIAALYSAVMWFLSEDSYKGRAYWVVALSAFAVQSALNGYAFDSLPWGLALLLTGGILFLFDPPIRRVRFIPILGLLGLIGLPFTLAASGWEGILGKTFTFSSAAMIFSHSLLLLGYLRHVLETNTTITGLDKHARFTFPLGLILILQTILILGLVGWPGVLTTGVWWGSTISVVLAGLGVFGLYKLGLRFSLRNLASKLPFYRFFSLILGILKRILNLGWIFKFGEWSFRQLAAAGAIVTGIIEGEGGILWSLTFLVILIILFVSRINLP